MDNSIPWTEKYRPASIADIILDDPVERQIKICLGNRQNIHLLITGSPGIGKTTTAKCIAKETLGEDIKEGYLELNAADDRGVKSISSLIPKFCKKIVDFKTSKVILLDEADNLTSKCQYDINNMIKEFGKTTKFIFTCNDSTKIIEDIQSVCRIIRFGTLSESQINRYLSKICDIEDIKYDTEGLSMIYHISKGDMRKSINDLQKTAYTFGKINKKNVLGICKVPDPDEILSIIDLCKQKNLIDADKCLDNIIRQGYYYSDIISGFADVLIRYSFEKYYPKLNEIELDRTKLRLLCIINNTKIDVSTGLRSRLQLSSMICRLISEFSMIDKEYIK